MKRFTPENITELQENEVFVFGSNLNGNHAGGAARIAVEKFGARMGQAEGLQGQSYAIPTLDKDMNKRTEEDLRVSIQRLYAFAEVHCDKVFLVTKVGCGIAGFTEAEMKDAFSKFLAPANVVLPKEFCVTKGFKAFDTDMTCRGFQYESGKTYDVEVKE